MGERKGPFAGIRIFDLTSVLFGPYAAQILGDWGADVIKIETLEGDTWRYCGQFRNHGMSGQFMAVNRNKRSLALDLKNEKSKARLAPSDPDDRRACHQQPSCGADPAWLRL